MKRYGILGIILCWATFAAAQYTLSPPLVDLCGQPADETYQLSGSYKNAVVAVGGSTYLVYGHPNSIREFTLGNPLAPAPYASPVQLPWHPAGGGTHEGITDHIRSIVTLSGYPYAYVAMYTYGWDMFDVAAHQFKSVGYHPANVLDPAMGHSTGVLFNSGGQVYLVTADLKVWRVTTMPPVQVATINAGAATGTPGRIQLYAIPGSVVVKNRATLKAVVVSVANPSAPAITATWTNTGDTRLWYGEWAFDGTTLYASTATDAVVYVYTLPGPAYQQTVRWGPTGTLNTNAVAVGPGLLTSWSGYKIGYVQLPSLTAMPAQVGVTDLSARAAQCYNAGGHSYSVSAQLGTPFAVGGNVYAVRSNLVYGDVVQVGGSVVPTPTPTPAVGPPPPTPTPGQCPPCPCLTPTPTPTAGIPPTPTPQPAGDLVCCLNGTWQWNCTSPACRNVIGLPCPGQIVPAAQCGH